MEAYRYATIDIAIQLLRPGSSWEMSNLSITKWNDPRPCPTWEEISETVEKIKRFEESINTIWLDDDYKEMQEKYKNFSQYLDNKFIEEEAKKAEENDINII